MVLLKLLREILDLLTLRFLLSELRELHFEHAALGGLGRELLGIPGAGHFLNFIVHIGADGRAGEHQS